MHVAQSEAAEGPRQHPQGVFVNGQEPLFAERPPAARNRVAGGLGFKCTQV